MRGSLGCSCDRFAATPGQQLMLAPNTYNGMPGALQVWPYLNGSL